MTKRTRGRPVRLLTETELELMGKLWDLGEGTVREVLERLPPERPLAYTSVATILRILEQKGVLASRKEGRGHVYVPLVRKGDYQTFALEQVIGKVFDGEPLELVRRLVDGRLSRTEIASVQALVDSKARPEKGKR